MAESANNQLLAKFHGLWAMIQTQVFYIITETTSTRFLMQQKHPHINELVKHLYRERGIQKKKQRLCTVGDSKVLPCKDTCIICNELVCLYVCNTAKANKKLLTD